MGQKLFQGGKAMDILDFRDEGSQRSNIPYRKVFRLIRQLVEKVSYFLFHPFNSSRQAHDSFTQDGYSDCQSWLFLKHSNTVLGCFYQP